MTGIILTPGMNPIMLKMVKVSVHKMAVHVRTVNVTQMPTLKRVIAVIKIGDCLPLSIVSLDRYNPAINTNHFPNTQSNWFWSSSSDAGFSSGAWFVYFGYGYSSDDFKYNYGYVRFVR